MIIWRCNIIWGICIISLYYYCSRLWSINLMVFSCYTQIFTASPEFLICGNFKLLHISRFLYVFGYTYYDCIWSINVEAIVIFNYKFGRRLETVYKRQVFSHRAYVLQRREARNIQTCQGPRCHPKNLSLQGLKDVYLPARTH